MKTSADRFLSAWMIMAAAGVATVPLLALVGPPAREAWGFLAASALVHVGYALSLAAAYDRADLSVAYPLARGLAPVITAAGGVLLLSDQPTATAWAGIIVITAALSAIALRSGASGVGFAVLTAFTVAAYTLIDAGGVRRIDDSLRYTLALFLLASIGLTVAVVLLRSGPAITRAVRSEWLRNLGGGLASLGAYGLVLAAVQLAPVGVVAAARETSVVFGALAGWLILGEDLGAQRAGAAAIVAAGVVLLVA